MLAENVHISADGRGVEIIDQTRLPGEKIMVSMKTPKEMYAAIEMLQVRGAPAIGIFAAYCLYCLADRRREMDKEDFLQELEEQTKYLNSARPTAVNLSWALGRMMNVARTSSEFSVDEIVALMGDEAVKIQREDIVMCAAVAENGLSLLKDGDGVLTHCNAGPLATSRYGTALGPLLLGAERGMAFHVFADETRPLLQGARLTSYELAAADIDVTLICDNMAATVMNQGKVNACLVGCDRIAANGDTANKIGTMGVAILAKHFGIPFYVLGPTSTIDLSCPNGAAIPVEERPAEEIKTMFYQQPMAPEDVACYNPSFDVTPADLITAIVTEKGIAKPPFDKSLVALFK